MNETAAEKRGKLLIVHDHQRLRGVIASTLERWGYEVELAEDNSEGLRKARKMKPDLVFCDLNVNGLPCLDLLKTLKRELPEAKFVITGADLARQEGEKLGACFWLSNPLTVAHLKAALYHCLGHSVTE
jgi:DNA-binding response OmpR family regulator